MRLSTLWSVDRLVRSDGGNPIADALLSRWDHDAGSARFFRSSANFLYRFRREGEPYFLRFASDSERSPRTMEAELDLLMWLAAKGLIGTSLVPSRRGRRVESVLTDLGLFHAVVFPAIEGKQRDIAELDEHEFVQWGAALGNLHAAFQRYRGPALDHRSTLAAQLEQAPFHVKRAASNGCFSTGRPRNAAMRP